MSFSGSFILSIHVSVVAFEWTKARWAYIICHFLKIASLLMAGLREYKPNVVETPASRLRPQVYRCWLNVTAIVSQVTSLPASEMALIKTVVPSLVGLVVLCLFAAEIYHLYGHHIELVTSRRSLEKGNKTIHLEVKFPNNYHATGRLFLPHSKIVEPFEIWFTSKFNRSRIDYYYGTF